MMKELCRGFNIAALRFGDHGTKEMLGEFSFPIVCRWMSCNSQTLPTQHPNLSALINRLNCTLISKSKFLFVMAINSPWK